MTYRLVSGAPSGTYVIVAPLTSLRMMDNGQARNPAYAESLTEGAGAANRKLATDTVVSRENTILRVQPTLSRVPADFWAPPATAPSTIWRCVSSRWASSWVVMTRALR